MWIIFIISVGTYEPIVVANKATWNIIVKNAFYPAHVPEFFSIYASAQCIRSFRNIISVRGPNKALYGERPTTTFRKSDICQLPPNKDRTISVTKTFILNISFASCDVSGAILTQSHAITCHVGTDRSGKGKLRWWDGGNTKMTALRVWIKKGSLIKCSVSLEVWISNIMYFLPPNLTQLFYGKFCRSSLYAIKINKQAGNLLGQFSIELRHNNILRNDTIKIYGQ